MFLNLTKKILDRNLLLKYQFFFDLISGGEENYKVQVLAYDCKGDVVGEENISSISNNYEFLSLFGNHMLIWLSQMFDEAVILADEYFCDKIMQIIKLLTIRDFVGGKYNLSELLSLFDQETKMTVVKNKVSVQFKINKVNKNLFVRIMNSPILQERECQLYLFIILFDFFVKKYPNAFKLMKDSSINLFHIVLGEEFQFSKTNPTRFVAQKIAANMTLREMNQLTNITEEEFTEEPEDYDSLFEKANDLTSENRNDEAIKIFRKLLEMNLDDESISLDIRESVINMLIMLDGIKIKNLNMFNEDGSIKSVILSIWDLLDGNEEPADRDNRKSTDYRSYLSRLDYK